MAEKEFDYWSKLYQTDMEKCTCGHEALLHSYWVGDGPPLTYLHCNVSPCPCLEYKRDNLYYLEERFEKKRIKDLLLG